jgi:hypothetical protein
MATVRGRPTANAMMSATSCALRGVLPEPKITGPTRRRRSRTYQPMGYIGLPVLKTGWATGPLPPQGAQSMAAVAIDA